MQQSDTAVRITRVQGSRGRTLTGGWLPPAHMAQSVTAAPKNGRNFSPPLRPPDIFCRERREQTKKSLQLIDLIKENCSRQCREQTKFCRERREQMGKKHKGKPLISRVYPYFQCTSDARHSFGDGVHRSPFTLWNMAGLSARWGWNYPCPRKVVEVP